jgi:hypothetical protein
VKTSANAAYVFICISTELSKLNHYIYIVSANYSAYQNFFAKFLQEKSEILYKVHANSFVLLTYDSSTI